MVTMMIHKMLYSNYNHCGESEKKNELITLAPKKKFTKKISLTSKNPRSSTFLVPIGAGGAGVTDCTSARSVEKSQNSIISHTRKQNYPKIFTNKTFAIGILDGIIIP